MMAAEASDRAQPASRDIPAANSLEAAVRRFDDFQRRHPSLALPIGVLRKYADDNGGILAAVLTYYAFLSAFPFLLLCVTVLGFFLGGPEAARSGLASFLSEFPIVGDRLVENIRSIQAQGLGLALGLLGTMYGSLGVLQAAQYALAEITDHPRVERPNPFQRFGRSIVLTFGALATLLFVVWMIGRGMDRPTLDISTIGEFAASVGVTAAMILVTYHLLSPRRESFRQLLPGALTASVAWTTLLAIATYLATNQLRNASDIYGFFGIVIGLMAWMALASNFFVIGAEVNVVRSRGLWPRTLLQPPILSTDEEVLTNQVLKEKRRPEQDVSVTYTDADGSAPPAEQD